MAKYIVPISQAGAVGVAAMCAIIFYSLLAL